MRNLPALVVRLDLYSHEPDCSSLYRRAALLPTTLHSLMFSALLSLIQQVVPYSNSSKCVAIETKAHWFEFLEVAIIDVKNNAG